MYTPYYTNGRTSGHAKWAVVYALVEPETNAVRYVGSSVDPLTRYRHHITEAQRVVDHPDPKYAWMKQLLAEGHEPRLAILEEFSGPEEARGAERRWITHLHERGHDLFNREVRLDRGQDSRLESARAIGAEIVSEQPRPDVSRPLLRPGTLDPRAIKYYRYSLRMTQQDLAAAAGIATDQVSRWECGSDSMPRPSSLDKLAAALGTSPETLLVRS